MQAVNILGSEWTITFRGEDDDPKLMDRDGYCDESVREIVVESFEKEMHDAQACADMRKIQRNTIRHELVHAFLFESGLGACSEWAQNEEMVDWIARQFSKLAKAFADAGAVE